jgi:replication factor C small subunit
MDLWTEKYRPTTLDGYVFRDEIQKNAFASWIKEGTLPHLMLSGGAGVGKTTAAKILINEIGIDPYDVLEINASRENSVDVMREKINGFVQTIPFGKFKVVLLDEFDFMTPNAQAALRGIMETYASTARFILTLNYPNRVIPAIHSRCQSFHIEKLDLTEFTARVATILVEENVEFDLDVLDIYVRASYPDMRKCINSCQMNSKTGSLIAPSSQDSSEGNNYLASSIELFKSGKIREARTLLCSNIRQDEVEGIFRWMYNNLDLWGNTPEEQDRAIVVIKNGLVNHALCADSEINLSATIVELCEIAE